MRWTVGDTEVRRVEETVQLSFKPDILFPAFERESLAEHASWLVPEFFDLAEDRFRTSVHSFLVRTNHHTVLIDTCGGNHKHRPYLPRFHERSHPWLERLAAAGVTPEQVDFVMCTHLHLDHVGWNTKLVDGRWVPTFPNAKYIFHRKEVDRWNPQHPSWTFADMNDFTWQDSVAPVLAAGQAVIIDGRWVPTFPNAKYIFHRKEVDRWNPQHPSWTFADMNDFTWQDSVAPVIAAGQAVIIDDGYTLDDALTVEPAPGHTLGHARIRLRDSGQQGIFSGDLMHVPLQVYYPHWGTCLDDAPELGVQSRMQLLETCVETRALLMPTHFAAPHCCRITRRGREFGIDWSG